MGTPASTTHSSMKVEVCDRYESSGADQSDTISLEHSTGPNMKVVVNVIASVAHPNPEQIYPVFLNRIE